MSEPSVLQGLSEKVLAGGLQARSGAGLLPAGVLEGLEGLEILSGVERPFYTYI